MAAAETLTPPIVSRILIVDDHPAVRRGLCDIVSREPGLAICGEAGTINEAREKIEAEHPDVLVIDIFLKNENGLDLIREIQGRQDAPKMLVCSMHPPWSYAKEALNAGASGYISKAEAVEQLSEAIRSVLGGGTFIGTD